MRCLDVRLVSWTLLGALEFICKQPVSLNKVPVVLILQSMIQSKNVESFESWHVKQVNLHQVSLFGTMVTHGRHGFNKV